MKIIKQIKLANKIMNLRMVIALTSVYAIVYGILFGLIFNSKDLRGILFQTCLWFLVYGYVFFGITGGVGILSIFYNLISFGRDRKTAFSVWSMTVLLSGVFSLATLIPFVLAGKYLLEGETSVPFFLINISQKSIGGFPMGIEMGQILANTATLVGIGMFLNILIAFFCTVGVRFGWQMAVGAVLLTLSVIMVLFIADINILFVTGHNLLRYLVGIYGLSLILYGSIYFLSQKWEVKN